MEYGKLLVKIRKKWLGKQAVTTSEQFYGRTGTIDSVKLQPVIDQVDKYKLFFVINSGTSKIVSPEETTVLSP